MTRRPAEALALLVVQPTAFCNINCSYCYLPERLNRRVMSSEVLDALFRRVFESARLGPRLEIAWHAGEPLVVPRAFYTEALHRCETYNRRGVEVTFRVQTNATLIDGRWAAFLKTRAFGVGVSIDGPAFLHDVNRRTRSGAGSFTAVMRGISHLRQAGVPFDAMAVITRQTLPHADALLDFFARLGARRVGFNVENQEGVHAGSSVDWDEIHLALPRFLDRLVERHAQGLPFRIRELEEAAAVLRTRPSLSARHPAAAPFRIVNVNVNGDVSTFSPELMGQETRFGPIRFGNVLTDRLDDLLAHPTCVAIAREIDEGIERCRTTCAYFDVCGGGCPSSKFFENGTCASTVTRDCAANIMAVVDAVSRGGP